MRKRRMFYYRHTTRADQTQQIESFKKKKRSILFVFCQRGMRRVIEHSLFHFRLLSTLECQRKAFRIQKPKIKNGSSRPDREIPSLSARHSKEHDRFHRRCGAQFLVTSLQGKNSDGQNNDNSTFREKSQPTKQCRWKMRHIYRL